MAEGSRIERADDYFWDNWPQGSADPSDLGQARLVDGAFRFKDALGVFNPRTGGSGITEAEHESLDTLTHELSENRYTEVTRDAGKVVNVTEWETSSKLKKIRECNISRAGGKVSVLEMIQYDSSGSWKAKLTGTVARDGGKVSTISWVRATP